MSDLLYESARAYLALTDYRYTVIAGRREKTVSVPLVFPLDAYHHLAGLQYSRIEALKIRKQALPAVLSGKVTFDMLQASGFQHADRLLCILSLQERIESNRFVFRYAGHELPYSRIRADYLFQWNDTVFFSADGIPVSIFQNGEQIDYAMNCPRFTVLRILRQALSEENAVIVYER